MHIRRALGVAPMTIVLALSIAAPAVAQSPAPAGSVDPPTPAWVTGTIQLAPSCVDATTTMSNGIGEERGWRCAPQTWVMSDPRLSGSAVASWNADVYAGVAGRDSLPTGTVRVWASRYEVTNDAGTWSCWSAHSLTLGPAGPSETMVNDETLTCGGGGAYEGLTAIVIIDEDDTVTAFIIPRGVPPIP